MQRPSIPPRLLSTALPGLLTVAALTLCTGSACSQGARPRPHNPTTVKGLSYRLNVEFRREKPGDGAPTLHFHHRFHNHTKRDLYLSFQGDPLYFRSITPDSRFKVIVGKTHPSSYSGMPGPPGPDQIVKVPAGKSARHKTWRWVGALSLNYDDRKGWRQYIFKKTGKVRVKACYNTSAIYVEMHKQLLPAGAKLWQGEVCAPAAAFVVKQLSKDAKHL
jgi:hypothetical protein